MDRAKLILQLDDIELAQDRHNFIISYAKEGKKRHAEFHSHLDEALVGLSQLMIKRRLGQGQIKAVEEMAALIRGVEREIRRDVLDRLHWDELGRMPSRPVRLSTG